MLQLNRVAPYAARRKTACGDNIIRRVHIAAGHFHCTRANGIHLHSLVLLAAFFGQHLGGNGSSADVDGAVYACIGVTSDGAIRMTVIAGSQTLVTEGNVHRAAADIDGGAVSADADQSGDHHFGTCFHCHLAAADFDNSAASAYGSDGATCVGCNGSAVVGIDDAAGNPDSGFIIRRGGFGADSGCSATAGGIDRAAIDRDESVGCRMIASADGRAVSGVFAAKTGSGVDNTAVDGDAVRAAIVTAADSCGGFAVTDSGGNVTAVDSDVAGCPRGGRFFSAISADSGVIVRVGRSLQLAHAVACGLGINRQAVAAGGYRDTR